MRSIDARPRASAKVFSLLPRADRPKGKCLLATIGKGYIIVTAKLDRAFRSAADALAVLELITGA